MRVNPSKLKVDSSSGGERISARECMMGFGGWRTVKVGME
jgi:hypothetical protein